MLHLLLFLPLDVHFVIGTVRFNHQRLKYAAFFVFLLHKILFIVNVFLVSDQFVFISKYLLLIMVRIVIMCEDLINRWTVGY